MAYPAQELLDQMVKAIVEEVSPEQVILFGSWARGTPRPDSDVDFLIVESQPFGPSRNRRQELTRLWLALSRFAVPKDILVYSREEVEHWKHAINHVIARAFREGRVVYDKH